MTARRVTKHFLTMVLIAAAMLAIEFSFDSAQVFAENKPLQRGQIYRLGTCAEPGDGYGQNADYKVLTDGDTFPYNGEYIAFSETGKGYLIHGYDSDEPSYVGANVQFTYITKYRNYGGQPGDGAWGSQHDYYTDNPGGYYSNIKYSDRKYYRFVIMPRRTYRQPDTAGWAGEDQGEPWALQITRGDGTRDNPYRFQVLLEEPYKIDIKVGEHGTADVRAGAPVGDKVKIEGISPDEGYELDKIVMRKGDGTETEIQPEAEGDYESYYFTMPEEDVSIEVSFKEKDGAISVIGTDGSAEHFDSLEKALSSWKDGTTLKVNDNVTLNGPVTVTDSRTLDLNGYVVKTEGKAFIVKDGGSLTVKDSKPTRRNRLEGTDYIGGHILGSVSGKDKNGDTVMSGVIDVANGSFTLNGGTIINQYGKEDDVKWGLSVTTGAKVTLNDGCIKATKIAIVDSKKDVAININGGRYNLDAVWPVESKLPDPEGVVWGDKCDHSMVTVTGGYYIGDSLIMMSYWRIAEGYEYESRSIDLIDWEYENYTARVSDMRQAMSITITENIENGAVQTADPYAKPGDTVTLKATPAEHYRVKNYIVTDADGHEVEVKDGKFIMPESAVTINAAFEPIKVSKLRLNKVRVTLNEVGSYKLKAVVTPSDALDTDVTWSSSDEDVATVDANGNVKAVRAGKAKIIAASADGGDTVVCTVTVTHKHHLKKIEEMEANCQTAGNIEHWICTDDDHACHKTFLDENGEKEIPYWETQLVQTPEKHKHLETRTITLQERTCTKPLIQQTVTTCPACGAVVSSFRHGEAALGHKWGDWETVTPATDTEPGLEMRVCQREGCPMADLENAETRNIPVLNHEHEFTKVEAVPAGCTDPGNMEYYVCKDEACAGQVFLEADETTKVDPQDVIVPPSGHTEGDEVREKERAATCDAPELYDLVVYCKDCKEELKRAEVSEGSALGHDWSACEKADDKKHKWVCSRCDKVMKGDHNWDDGREISPTCIAGGKTVYTCKDCGYQEDRLILEPDESAHILGPNVQENRVNATFDKIGGYDLVKRCDVCGEVINSTHVEIPKLEKEEYNINIKTKVEGGENVIGGTVTGAKDKGKKGERYKITANPRSGFEFLYWLVGGKKTEGTSYNLFVDSTDPATEVTVEAVFKRSELPFNGEVMLKVGESYDLGEELYPMGTMPEDIVWDSSDSKVAAIDALGVIHAVAVGKADITGTLSNGTVKVTYKVTVDKKADQPDKSSTDTDVKLGSSYNVSGSTYKVTAAGTVALTKAKNAKSISIPASVKINGKTFHVTEVSAKAFTGKKIRTVTIGKNVKKLKANAFKGSDATKLIVKSKVLTKKSVKGSLKGSKIKNVKVKVGKKSINKKYVKKYKKIFTKKNAGKKVSVK